MKKGANKAPSFRALKSQNTKARKLIQRARDEIAIVAKEEKFGATKRAKAEIDRIVADALAELDRLELENERNLITIERLETHVNEQFKPYLVAETELIIRGYWDAYPKSDQRKHAKNYKHLPSDWLRGETAYDIIARTWENLTPYERAHLQVRVAYGMNPETGKILPSRFKDLEDAGFVVNPLGDKEAALETIIKLLVRGDYIDTPRGYSKSKRQKMTKKGGKTSVAALSPIPVGLQWWIIPNVNDEYK